MVEIKTVTLYGRPSYVLESREVRAAVTQVAGMLAPVIYYRDTHPIQPYAIAPWAEENLDEKVTCLRVLRGDFMCSAFGGNERPFQGKRLPVHGETANNAWDFLALDRTAEGVLLRLSMEMPVQNGKCEKQVALLDGHSVVYQRHDFSEIEGSINPGHHATLQFPDSPGAGVLSFSSILTAHTYIHPTERPEDRGYSWLKPNAEVADLNAVPCIDGDFTDVTSYPARRGYEDIMIVCSPAGEDIAWVAVTFSSEGYVWFALRDPKLLPSTLLWMSNGGRHYPPWNGRHINVMGVENICGFFHEGLASSSEENLLNKKGVRTCHILKRDETLRIPYIQGVARIGKDFDRVKAIEMDEKGKIRLVAHSGAMEEISCDWEFIHSGRLRNLIE